MSRRLAGPLVLAMAVAVAAVALLSAGGPASGQVVDPVLVAAGDIASCNSNGDEATANLVKDIDGTVATLGDNAYESGTSAEYTQCYEPSWGQFKARTMPSVGNHEYYTAGASGYFGYFGAAAGDPNKGYYSYDLGTWHVVVLNSNCAEVGGCDTSSAQGRWLTDDLAAHPNACTLAYFHHPRFTSAKLGNNSAMGPFWEALYNAGAEVVLNGHAHVYERFAPQTPAGQADSAQGIREFVVGTGGRSLNAFGTVRANSEKRLNTADGVIKLTLHPNAYDWQFVTAPDGTVADSGSKSCHGGSSPPSGDTTAPTVMSTVPASNATGVSPTADVKATFSEDMATSSINGTTFTLKVKGSTTKLAAAIGYDPNTRTATLDPTDPLQTGVTYKATVTVGAKDLAGNRLDQDGTKTGSQQKAWSFTVGN
jgi:hypothetical protein